VSLLEFTLGEKREPEKGTLVAQLRDEPGCGEGLPKGLVPSDGRVEAFLFGG